MLAGVGVGVTVTLIESAISLFINAVCRLDRKVLKSVCLLRHVPPPVCTAARNISAATGGIFMKFDILSIFRIFFENIRISLKYDKNRVR
jgi:hypothetical protein